MGSRLQSFLARIRADLHRAPVWVWISIGIAAITLFVIYRAAHSAAQTGSTSTTPNLLTSTGLPTYSGAVDTSGSLGSGASGGGTAPSTAGSALPFVPAISPPLVLSGDAAASYAPPTPPTVSTTSPALAPAIWTYPANQAAIADLTRALPTAPGAPAASASPSSGGGRFGFGSTVSALIRTGVAQAIQQTNAAAQPAAQADLTRALPTMTQGEPDPYGVLATLPHGAPIQGHPTAIQGVPVHAVSQPAHYALHVQA